MRLVWISDFFLKNVPTGGAEQVDNVVIEHLRGEHVVSCVRSEQVTMDQISDADAIFISNFTRLSSTIKSALSEKKYFIFEHDHKYLSTRDPSQFKNHLAPLKFIVDKQFYKNARCVFAQSSGHAAAIVKNLFISNVVNLEGSLWTQDQFDYLEEVVENKKTKTHAIVQSNNPVKNTHFAEIFCRKNKISYDVIPPSQWQNFVKELSSYKNLVFFPKVYESSCRLAIEARMLDVKLITNSNVGAASDEWFRKYKGRELISHLRIKSEEILSTISTAVSGPVQTVELDYPKVSIISSMFEEEDNVVPFMDNITSQSYFDNCELIIVNANSPENEESLLRPYLVKHQNIKYINLKKDPGLYGTWNIAIEKSTGEYITNANFDDRKSLLQIEDLARYLKYNTEDSLVYNECYVTEQPQETFEKNSSDGRRYSVKDFSPENMIKCLPGPMPMWRRVLHDSVGYFNNKFKSAGDWEFWLRAVRAGHTFKKNPSVLGLYHLNPEGLSTSPKDSQTGLNSFSEEKQIFQEFKDVFGPLNYAIYKEYFESE